MEVVSVKELPSMFDSTVDEYVRSMGNVDHLSETVLRLAVISLDSQWYQALHGRPDRPSYHEPGTEYWKLWDYGTNLAKSLASRCKIEGLDPTECVMWPLVDSFFIRIFNESYEFSRPVVVPLNCYESMCKAIYHNNLLKIGEYELIPGELEESSDHYGVDVAYLRWTLYRDSVEVDSFLLNDYDLSLVVYERVFCHSPDFSARDEHYAKKLRDSVWSIFD